MVSQAYSGYAEICPGFPPPQAACVTVASGGKGALGSMVQQCSALAGFKYVFRVIILLVASINPGTAEW